MKRKMTFYTVILTAFLLCGCTTGNTQDGETPTEPTNTEAPASTGENQGTEQTQGSDQMQNTEQTQDTDLMQGTDQMQGTEQSPENNQTQNSTDLQGNTVQGGDAEAVAITEDEAKEIALSHAGLTTEEITFIQCELDIDDGTQYYDVEFYTQDQKDYDYEIDAYTGEIIEWDVEPIHDINS